MIRFSSLFVKIFLSFWLTHLLLIGGTAATLWVAQQPNIQNYHDTRPQQLSLLRKATSNLINFGVDYTEAWLVSQPLQLRDKLYIVNASDNQDILNRRLPENVHLLTKTLGEFTPVLHLLDTDYLFVARYTALPGDQAYKLVVLLPGIEMNWRFLIAENPGISIALSIIITGLICYWLARYITQPIRRLRNASKKIAHGDLDTKVTPEFSNRKDELIDLAMDFDQMTTDLKVSIQMQQRLIQDVSHELKSPLARQQVAIEIARNKVQSEDGLKLLDKIELESNRLRDIINDILNLPEAQVLQHLDRSEQDELNSILKGVISEAEDVASQHNIQIQYQAHDRLLPINTRGHLLSNALFNIIQNAIRHSPDNSCVIIQVDVQQKGYEITITDQGNGVPEKDLPFIFKAFYRVDKDRSRHSGGVGLGLAITKRIVDLHEGTIKASNHPKAGLCVTIWIPK